MTELRAYQRRGVESVYQEWTSGKRRVCMVMPTGSGKTATAAKIVNDETERGGSVLWVVDKRELIFQASERLNLTGVDHGIILSGKSKRMSPVQVASAATLHTRKSAPNCDLLVWDECHIATARKIADLYPNARHLGLTATPARLQGGKLVPVSGWDAMVEVATQSELLAGGWVVPVRVHAPHAPSMSGVRRVGGDFETSATERIMSEPVVLRGAVDSYLRWLPDQLTAVFAVNVNHAFAVQQSFGERGIRSEVIHGGMDRDLRTKTLEAFSRGVFRVLISVDVLTAGWDCPHLRGIITMRPTDSLTVYLQQIGRGVRPAPGKTECIWIDHTGNLFRHGHPQLDREWAREGRIGKPREKTDSLWRCEDCFTVVMGRPGKECPICGAVVRSQTARIREVDGVVEEYDEEELLALEALRAEKARQEAEMREVNGRIIRYLIGTGKGMGLGPHHARARAFKIKAQWEQSGLEWKQYRRERGL